MTTVQPQLPDIAEQPAPPEAVQGRPFTTLLAIEGLETSDGRMFELGTMTWRQLPWPFMVQDTSPHGPGQIPEPAWAAGQIEEVFRDPADQSRILGRGHLMPGEVGERAYTLAKHSFRGVSIDAYPSSPVGPDMQLTAVDQDGEPLDVLLRYSDAVLSRATMVPTPAFEACCIWFDDEEMPAAAADAHGAVIATDTEPQTYEITDPYEQLVASAGGPVEPPRDWFFKPPPPTFQPWQVTPDGQLSGHIAQAGQCHLGILGECQTAPKSTTSPPYKAFHRTLARCNDGSEVACGWLTIGTKHERLRADADETADHYDHTGTLAAKIRLSNTPQGIWATGALCPGLTDRDVWLLQGPEVSPDWRRWQDPDTGQWHSLELVAALAVPFPGYPHTRTRPELLVASGEIVAQFGTLEPCCDDCEGEPMTEAERQEIDARFAAIEAKQAELHGALVAAGTIDPTVTDPAIEAAASHAFVDANGDGKCDVCGMPKAMHDTAAAVDDELALVTTDDETTASEDDEIELSIQERARWFAKYTADQKKQMAKAGKAMGSDGSFPIADVEDLQNAIRAAGHGSGDHNAIRRHIMRNAALLKKQDMIPKDWSADGSSKAA